MNYILMQKIKHRTYSETEQTIMFLNNMDEKKYYGAENNALEEVRQITGSNAALDPNLMLDSLPITLEQYHEQIHGTVATQPQRFIRSMYDDNNSINLCDDVSEEDNLIIGTFSRRNNQRPYQNGRSNRQNDSYNNNCPHKSYDGVPKQCKACERWGCSERK